MFPLHPSLRRSQVRFATLRNTVAEASATDTHKYLMTLCREEDAKSDSLGNKGHLKTNGDGMAIGGKHYSGCVRVAVSHAERAAELRALRRVGAGGSLACYAACRPQIVVFDDSSLEQKQGRSIPFHGAHQKGIRYRAGDLVGDRFLSGQACPP